MINKTYDGYGTALLAAQGYYLQCIHDGLSPARAAADAVWYMYELGEEEAPLDCFVDVMPSTSFGWLCDYQTSDPLRPALPQELHKARVNNTSRIESQLTALSDHDWFVIDKPPGEGSDPIVIPEEY